MKTKYDLIIVGGGTAGCAAAYIAGKAGLSVLIIEKNGCMHTSIM
jgi:flavin-dependent dehydrogenase